MPSTVLNSKASGDVEVLCAQRNSSKLQEDRSLSLEETDSHAAKAEPVFLAEIQEHYHKIKIFDSDQNFMR